MFFSFEYNGENLPVKTSTFYAKKKNRISRYIAKAMWTLNEDLRQKSNKTETKCKITEDGEIMANDFCEYDFSLSSNCCGLYLYWY